MVKTVFFYCRLIFWGVIGCMLIASGVTAFFLVIAMILGVEAAP